jgi:hypothetical protein
MSSTSLDDASFVLIETDSPAIRPGKAFDRVTQVSCQNSMNQVHSSFAVLQQPVHSSQNLSYHPGSTHSYAHDWSERGTGGSMKIDGRNLVDAYGRVCNLRGVNMSGSSKMCVALSFS